ncbi:MAG: tRNA glutamyl-Q(34) synthetase GluQRS [Xanthomonadaceae bacterium]|nr:tRNA glutamyl-Q(34) synthetase GluQRS [Xanthomonadaceae bacterium]
MPAPDYRGRFAPSPTGPLHQGSLLAALASWLMARRADGQWLVRIEDLDPPREVAGAADCQLASLARLGLHSDLPVVRQSQRHALYQRALDTLLATGRAFACHCSRQTLAASGGIHRECLGGAQRATPAIRLRVDAQEIVFADRIQGTCRQRLSDDVGDFVLRRADGLWAYQLAVVVDDAAQGITHVVRGADLLDSTPRQLALQGALGLPTPDYAHIPLLLDADGRKLSKSLGARPIDDIAPIELLETSWRLLGQAPFGGAQEVSTALWLQQAVAAFDPDAIPRHTLVHPG